MLTSLESGLSLSIYCSVLSSITESAASGQAIITVLCDKSVVQNLTWFTACSSFSSKQQPEIK